ncbi:MAG TPA: acyltransferase [Croceibacterium sp.]|nr:acyltransferase [Croceibacterium sp.]
MIAPPVHPKVPQIDQLTGLRGLAAWLVVLFHVRLNCVNLLPGWTIDALGKGYLAVDVFFILSGFVMWLNYGARFRGGGWSEAPRFWWKRFARIWPLHAAILAAMAAFALLLVATGRDAGAYPFAELPLHILLLQNWGLTSVLSWNHPAWSISTEMAAYVLFPWVAIAVRWEKLRAPMLVAIVALCAVTLAFGFGLAGRDSLGADIPRFGLGRCLAEFGIGVALCNLWQLWRARRAAARNCALAAAAVLGIGIGLGLSEAAFLPLAFAGALLALALDGGPVARFFACKPLRWLGDVSYSTYLSHFFLFVLFKILFVGDDLQLGWATLSGFLALVLGASAVLYHGLEKPAQRWLNAHAPAFAARPALR